MANDPRESDETLPKSDARGAEPAQPSEPTLGETASRQPDPPSQIGRYRIERVLGKGGFGLVYLAHDDQLQRYVAIKVPHGELTSQPADAEAYLAEARMLAHLDHQHIVPVHDVGSTPEFPCFFVSKYIDGTDLSRRMEQSPLTYAEAAEFTATVAEALHYAHKQGLVHRDIKPGNILIDRSGKPYVVDFGLALKEAELGRGPRYAGTPAYMSPEQARGEGHRVDGRSDIYSLGAVLYRMLTGRRTFTADTREELLELIASQEPKPPRQIDDRIPKELERICLRALSRRGSDRYTTAKDMAEDLRHFLEGSEASQASASAAADTEQHPGADSSTPRTESATPVSDGQPIKIVPKGLRSFDEHDADFFLELLSGPRDREGLPDSIRFWKTRIEELDADKTFAVGLIYGPSGCGKSSLVKAGLLARLSQDVITVYVEATGQETELRLLKTLRKRCPGLPQDLDLKQTLTALRRGQSVPVGKKVLVILDQFEQWLHANWREEHGELVQALRQCDGRQVQCILMVRDDFWMAATRFMRELEVRLVEGQNSAAVDLFPVRHAERVLAAFGRAFGTLPEKPDETTAEQKEFVKQAVGGLAEEGKVICVRLSLFAEMMKGKSWVLGVLRQVGGTEGVGVTFLEQTFSASTSPPEHRYHQKAARAVLRALLPESGTNIRGHMRSHADLMETSGYAGRPQDFAELLDILDRELRLITPTDPQEMDREDDSAALATSGRKHYQLTHDYLVPSLREWLTRKQKETRQGRAELRLAERAALWNAKRENRHLPSWWEYLNIRLLSDAAKWSESQRLMMRRAGRVLGLRWGCALLVAVVIAIAVQQTISSVRHRNLSERTQTAVAAMSNSRGIIVPRAIQDLEALPREMVLAELNTRFPDSPDSRKLGLGYALAQFGDVKVDFLVSQVKDASADEVDNLVAAMGHARQPAIAALKATAGAIEGDWRHKARVGIVVLHLGDDFVVREMSQPRPDPIQRTLVIDTFCNWHSDVAKLAPVVARSGDAAFCSGVCLGIGSIPVEELTAEAKQTWQSLLSEWFQAQPDPGTHSAAGWTLRQWGLPLPEIASSPEPTNGRQWYVNNVGITMLRIAEGSFSRRNEDVSNSPIQQVRITRPFFLSDREISLGLYERFVGDQEYPHEKPKDWTGADKEISPKPDHPMQQVNWSDAVMFCNWLSRKEGLTPCYAAKKETSAAPSGAAPSADPFGAGGSGDTWELAPGANGYRLPTEAEWEYACRAGTATEFSHGDDFALLARYAVFSAGQTEPCGSKLPNAWGLFDMHGNLWEWCQDWYGAYPAMAVADDPTGDPTGAAGGSDRVFRGGSWYNVASLCRASRRFWSDPGNRRNDLGFRLARTVSSLPR